MQADEKVKRGSARECASCLRGACQGSTRAVLIYMRVHLSLWEAGERLKEGVTRSILGAIMAPLPLTVTCLRGNLKPLCLFCEPRQHRGHGGQTRSPDNSRTGFHHRRVITVFAVCAIAGEARAESRDGYLSIAVPRSHPLSSSERCALLLISPTCQKLGEQLLGRTAALLILDT